MNLTAFKEHIESIGKTLDPDQDWMPVLFLQKDDQIAIVGLMMMENDEAKNICAKLIRKLISITNPDSICFITTAWMSRDVDNIRKQCDSDETFDEALERGHILRPSQDPNRIEIVSAVCMGVKGENDGQAFMIGEIQRHPDKPPEIKKWDIHEDDDDLMLRGRFADAIRNGFESVDKTGDLSRLNKMKGLINDGSSYS